jgi:sugar phosphate isomerase/epimerase
VVVNSSLAYYGILLIEGKEMTPQQLDYVRSTISNEGFTYTFHGYSDFLDIKDEEFHKLRKEYIEAAKKLAQYLNIEDVLQ